MINVKNVLGAAASLGLLTSASVGAALGDRSASLKAMAHVAADAQVGDLESLSANAAVDGGAGASASVEDGDDAEGSAYLAANFAAEGSAAADESDESAAGAAGLGLTAAAE